MNKKIIVEYNALLDEFEDITDAKKKSIIVALTGMIATEHYRYLKYLRLNAMLQANRTLLTPAMDQPLQDYTIGKVRQIMSGYDLANQLVDEANTPEKEPRKSHFRHQD